MSDLSSAAAALIAVDDEVRSRVRDLVLLAVDEAMEMMEVGSPPMKMQLVKSLMPAMVREMAKMKEESGVEELRGELRAVMAEVRGGTQAASEMEDADLHGGATFDEPPKPLPNVVPDVTRVSSQG